MAKTCTYSFTDPNGQQVVLTGQAAIKAWLVAGGLEYLRGAANDARASKARDAVVEDLVVSPYPTAPAGPTGAPREAAFLIHQLLPATKKLPERPGLKIGSVIYYKGMEPVVTSYAPTVYTIDEEAVLAVAKPGSRGGEVRSALKWVPSDDARASRARDITETPEFKAWSGGAPVVLAGSSSKYAFSTGLPVVVEGFHGTRRNFDRLDTGAASDGYFMSSKPIVANEYAGYMEGRTTEPPLGGNVQRQYARMDNPLFVNARGASFNRVDTRGIPGFDSPLSNTDAINRWAKSKGYDGVIYKDLRDSVSAPDGTNAPPSNVYAVFKSSQIKSVFNDGSFDEGDDNFLSSRERQTDTPAFKKWFGESKVVDAEGKPRIVYTGTSSDVDFSKFKAPKNGIWFAADPGVASDYAMDNDSQGLEYLDGKYVPKNTASRVMPVYLRMENPKVYDKWPDSIQYAGNYRRAQAALWPQLQAQGHDGVIGPAGTFVVFKPEQIKSAIGNNGQFDASNPNITRSAERFTEDQRSALEQSGRDAEEAIRSAPRNYDVDLSAQQEAEKPAKAWIEKVYAELPRNPMVPRQRMMMFGEDDFALLELAPSGLNPGGVTIQWIQAYPLRSGNGTKAIRELQRMAAEDGIELDLWPWDKGRVSQANLIKFYKSVGFEPMRRGSKDMIWRPSQEARRSAEREADAVYKEMAADEGLIDALEVYMTSGDAPDGALNDKLLSYMRRLPPVPADSYLTFYRNQPSWGKPWKRGWSSWTTNEDQTRFFGGRDFEVLRRKGAQGIDLNRLGEERSRLKGEYHQYGSQAEWLLLNESVFGPAEMAEARRSAERGLWYSQLSRAIESVPARLDNQSGVMWAQWLKANAAKLGVKQDEITWSGIEDFLKLKGKAKVSKDEIGAYLAEGGVRVEEVTLAGSGDEVSDADFAVMRAEEEVDSVRRNIAYARRMGQDDEVQALEEELRAAQEELRAAKEEAERATKTGGPTKYEQYTLPGGSRYREVLLTLPEPKLADIEPWTPGRMRAKRDVFIDAGFTPLGVDVAIAAATEAGGVEAALRSLDAKVGSGVYRESQKEARDILRSAVSGERKNKEKRLEALSKASYKSRHWDQKNILAHIRLNDRVDAEGRRVLLVEELQSDFGSDTRKQRTEIGKAVDADFGGIVERMKKAGVLEVVCD